MPVSYAAAVEPVPEIRVGAAVEHTSVPPFLRQGVFLPPQSISALDVSDDGRFIGVATMAFSHDRNVWVLSSEGRVLESRYVYPWAPFQIGVLSGGKAFGVGLACSMVTNGEPTIALGTLLEGGSAKGSQTLLKDNTAWSSPTCYLRYGAGDWRTGWLVSMVGDLIVRGGDSLVTVTAAEFTMPAGREGKEEPWRFTADGRREPFQALRGQRPFRMAASGDGRVLACAYLVPDFRHLEEVARSNGPDHGARHLNGDVRRKFHLPSDLVAVYDKGGSPLWRAGPMEGAPPVAQPPEPSREFPDLARQFVYMQPLAPVAFRVALSISANSDGSRVAVTEFGGWLRTQRAVESSAWNPYPPLLPFCPRQRGWLRVFDGQGAEVATARLPRDGLFEARLGPKGETVWCVPLSWFSRGLAGHAWLPADQPADTVFVFDVPRRMWTAWQFPDAVSDLAVHPAGDRAMVSCWDGRAYLVQRDGNVQAEVQVSGPGRVRWSADGTFAVLGTHDGQVFSLDADGRQRWRTALPVTPPTPVAHYRTSWGDIVPSVYTLGRPGPEHGNSVEIYLIKTKQGGILVDCGGAASGISVLWERIRGAGLDPKDVRYLLRTHSHGDHAGPSYLWRTLGVKVVAPRVAEFTTDWMMPVYSHYSIWVPCPVDVPLPLQRPGDETEIMLCGVRVKAILLPGHAVDGVVYAMDLDGVRVAFTGDVAHADGGGSNIYNRCWNDLEQAKRAVRLWREKVLPLEPRCLFAGHRVYRDGPAAVREILKDAEAAIAAAEKKRRISGCAKEESGVGK